jgi:uncharacterized membrane protein YphA (DoxX/SURF4 family)
MKYLANFLRICVGLLFIFSGLIKSNDPTGFSYKLDEYFSVFSADLEPKQDSVIFYFNQQNNTDTFSSNINPNQQELDIVFYQNPWINSSNEASIFERKISFSVSEQEIFNSNILTSDTLKYSSELNFEISNKLIGYKKIGNMSYFSESIDISSHIIPNSIWVDFFQKLRPYSVYIAIGICVIEVLLGIALILGWAPRLILSSIFILTVFFTFLTWYSAYFNKVTDCGCFGDAIKLTPWESFYKDIILGSATLIIAFGFKHIKPIFSTPFSVKILTVSLISSVGFSLYCWHYLPVINFLKFKKDNNIYELANIPDGAPTDVYENIFIYSKDGINEEFTISDISSRNLKEEDYVFVDRIDKLISKGYEPEIHDFKIMDVDRTNNYIEDFYSDSGYKLLIVFNDIEKSNSQSIYQLKNIIHFCKENEISMYPLTASKAEYVDAFSKKHNLNIPFYYGDKTNLKSIIRSNSGLILFQKNTVIENWPSTRLPSEKQLSKLIIQ